ncbi:DUF7948 domain-containing protein [Planktothricoides raciborskii]|uniref:SBBP repeat-containing protein n=1 Tax=Planktothricoides raciborskii FACHB-1370 TaxID=2949576 RepID=A0ABR8ELS1_9CYAN|nr:SBBP repeat-containing protein [Planktothricoides raciborskii]MBD2547475.1 SBBP repeat-containing protein [Planktothricoides raciborskii FACHB-1370]MBD2583791.1 SBBP repeat-containing protein [Planktothricoides raciborskii FACHB-1261]
MQDFLGFQQEQLPATSAFDVSEQQPNLGVVPGAGFDSDYYLTQYPDVAEAVSQGTFEDAWEHWLLYGQYENRAIAPMPLNTSEDVRQPGQDYLTGMITDDIPVSQDTLTTLPADGGTTQVNLIESYGKIPLSFEANQGQTDAQVNFLSRGNGYGVFLTPTEAVLSLRNPDTPATDNSGDNQTASGTVLRMELVGANAASQATGLEELATKSNYLKGNDSSQDLMDIPNYAQVKYENVYSGIDVIYYGNQRQLEYDFVVAPGADPNNIALNFQGADKVEIDAQGDLVLPTAGGEVRFYKPVIYQEVNGERQEVSGSYVIKNNQQVGFQVGSYDVSKTLIIDPVLSYSTYLGGNLGPGEPPGIVVDAQGNAYVTGTTTSPNFPKATFNNNIGGNDSAGLGDIFVAKINPQGSQLVYLTYIGGNSVEKSSDIAIDKDGNSYIVGVTQSEDFPASIPDDVFGGAPLSKVFIVKLNSTGGRVYSTIPYHTADYFPEDPDLPDDSILETLVVTDYASDPYNIAVDDAGNAYVAGYGTTLAFPTVNAFQDASDIPFSNQFDAAAFVFKLNPAGTDLIYSTLLGGNKSRSEAKGITVDKAGNAYVTGTTTSLSFPTLNAVQPTFGGGTSDAFVTKFNPTGGLVYSTYLGGSGDEQIIFDTRAGGIAVDKNGNAYVTGATNSTDFPKPKPEQTTLPNGQPDTSKEPLPPPQSFQPTYGGGSSDAFVAKLSADGSKLLYSTYLGSSDTDLGSNIAVNAKGNAYVTGMTAFPNALTDFPIENPLEETQNKDPNTSILNAFVTKLSPNGSSAVYSTLLGSNLNVVNGPDIAIDAAGNAYVTGQTDLPSLDLNSLDFTNFVAKISEERKPVLVVPGILGSFIANRNVKEWNRNRGLDPAQLAIDPILGSYDSIIKTLEDAGYKRDEDLFAASYDWRLAPFPEDGTADGKISGISAASIADDQYEYGVDYLGHWLRQAAEQWEKKYGKPLDSVNVIAHSTGGLVTRAYIQSNAYGGVFPVASTPNETKISSLPTIDKFIMLGVPNKGAPKAWNPINDDWNSDAIFGQVVSKFVNAPYQKLIKENEETRVAAINGPEPISLETLADAGEPNSPEHKQEFIEQYVPTIRALSPDYDFITNGTVPESKKNTFLLDLNGGTGIQSVIDNTDVTVAYGTNIGTITSVTSRDEPDKLSIDSSGGEPTPREEGEPAPREEDLPTVQSFTDILSKVPEGTWYDENKTNSGSNTGDGTVPIVSSFEPFNSDRVQHRAFNNVEHNDLPKNEGVQNFVLETLGAQLPEGKKPAQISKIPPGLSTALATMFSTHFSLDPVEGFLVDGKGQRLGYSEATGPLNEIPNSEWFGDTEGFGWVFDSVEAPVKIELTGLGEDHYVQASVQLENQVGSVESSGFLAQGEQRTLPIELTNAPSTNPTPTAGTENNGTVTTDSPTNPTPTTGTENNGTVTTDSPANPTPATGTENNETVTTDSPANPTPATGIETVDTTTTSYAPDDPIFDTDNLIKIVSDQEEPIYLLFDENYYLQQNPDVGAAVSEGIFKTGLRHFLQWGQIDANRPFRLLRFNFDEDTYLTQNPDVAAGASEGKIEPGIEHFLENGLTENRISNIQFTPSVQSLAFDEAYYLNKYPDVAESIADGDYVNGVEHFIKKGEKEQRDFRITTGNQSGKTLFFDENYYLANNPDVAEAVSQRKYRSGWQHFLKYGRFEGRKASTLID